MKSPVSRRKTALARTLLGMLVMAVTLGMTPTALLGHSTLRTEIPTLPAEDAPVPGTTASQNVQLALVIPLSVPPAENGPIPATELRNLIAPGGYLGRLLDLAERTGLSIAVDPYLVHSLLLADTPATQAFLLRLKQSSNDAFFMSYANTPVAYLEGFSDYPDILGGNIPQLKTFQAGDSLLDDSLFFLLDQSLWSPDSVLNPAIFANIPANIGRLLLSEKQMNVHSETAEDPEGVGTYLPALRQDGRIAFFTNESLGTTLKAYLDSPRESNYFALLQALRPDPDGSANSLVVTAPFSEELPDLLDRLAAEPSIRLVSLDAVPVQDGNYLDAANTEGIDLQLNAELVSDTASVLRADREAAAFLSALNSPDIASAQYRLLALQSLSQNYSDVERTAALLNYSSQVTELKKSISLEPGSDITLITPESHFWVSVNNALVSPAKVTIRFHASNNRLVIPTSVDVEVDGNSKQAVTVPISALANGQVTLQFTLFSETGVQIGQTRELQVQIQAEVELLAIILFSILVVGFLAAGIVRSLSKRKKQETVASGSDQAAENESGKEGNE